MIDFEQMRVFVKVVESGGFRSAAKELFKSQPAITQAIKHLESRLGFSLFDRTQYRPSLTDQGEHFYQRAKNLIRHWQDINALAGMIDAGIETDITLAIDIFYPLSELSPLFERWLSHYQQTHFHFLTESLGGASERLLKGEADIVITENLISDRAVELIPLKRIHMVPVASPSFIEKNGDKLHQLEQLSQCMQVILRDSSDKNFSFGLLEGAPHWTVSDVESKRQIIELGLGWGRMPDYMVNDAINAGRLCRLEGDHFDTRPLQLSAIRLQKPAHGPIAEALWDTFQEKANRIT